MRIAIIGAGISGLTAAYYLQQAQHDITMYEKNAYIGGHTNTVDVCIDDINYAVDTGFIVFNDRTYPNFLRLLNELKVSYQKSPMSFSVSNAEGSFEYNGGSLSGLFVQRKHLLQPAFYIFIKEIIRFNYLCKKHLPKTQNLQLTLVDFVKQHHFSKDFLNHYLYPLAAAIWSTDLDAVPSMPFKFFLDFFTNHGLLNLIDRPQWFTVKGGSRTYIPALTANFIDKIQLQQAVLQVIPQAETITVTTVNGNTANYDKVIIATHSDEARMLLPDSHEAQKNILANIPYQNNEVVLHTDARLLPKLIKARACWNYRLSTETSQATLTYYMNQLQSIQSATDFCVTVNQSHLIDPEKIIKRFNYSHPLYTKVTIAAQAQIASLDPAGKLLFCGAYCGYGFHEDGVKSGIAVAKQLGCSIDYA